MEQAAVAGWLQNKNMLISASLLLLYSLLISLISFAAKQIMVRRGQSVRRGIITRSKGGKELAAVCWLQNRTMLITASLLLLYSLLISFAAKQIMVRRGIITRSK